MFAKKKDQKPVRHNSGGTYTWQEKANKVPHVKIFRDSIMSTKQRTEGENPYEAALMPDFEDDDLGSDASTNQLKLHQQHLENEWVAENLVDYFHELNMLYQIFIHNNRAWELAMKHPEKLSNNGYPQDVKYLWKLSASTPPEEVSVEEYIQCVMEWIEKQVLDEKIFPTDGEEDFDISFVGKYAKKIFQRMFRIFAILLVNPLLTGFGVSNTEETESLKRLFSRFLSFAYHWRLINMRETKCISELVDPTVKKYNKYKEEAEERERRYNRRQVSYNF